MDAVVRWYNTVFYERADPRVKDWFLMTSPLPVATIIFTYLALIKLLLPAYMRNRKPYDLRGVIKWYNIGQMAICAICAWGLLTSGWSTTYHLGCVAPDYSDSPIALRMLFYMWFTVIIKLCELLETTFFILRKKDNQASFLHIYHHISSLVLIWCATKFLGGGVVSFPPLLNNSVHVIMYAYYLLSTEGGPKVRAVLKKYKKWLTILQITQFNVMLIHASQGLLPGCSVARGFTPFFFINIIIVYYLFYQFFKQNYMKKNSKQHLNSVQNGKEVKIH